MKNYYKYGLVLLISVLFSCGGDNDNSVVSLYLTDKLANQVQELDITITKMELLNTGNENSCVLFDNGSTSTEPNPLENINLVELSDSYLFVDRVKCGKNNYNRLRINFNENITVIDEDGTHQCRVEEFNPGSSNQPNKPHCDDGNCYIDINGEVKISSDKENFAVDFNLQQSEVNINGTNCTVKFKVSPLHIDKKVINDKSVILKGKVDNLDTDTFLLSLKCGKDKIAVDYSNVSQEGIDEILNLALENSADIRVKCSVYDSENLQCIAKEIYLILENVTIVNLDETNKLFTINLNGNSIIINYSNAEIDGVIVENAEAEIKINGYDQTDEMYLAKKVKIKD